MGLITKLAKATALASGTGVGAFFFLTRKSTFVPLDPASHPLFRIAQIQKFNPEKNPMFYDDCVRKVPLQDIRPELLDKDGELVKAFCAGVWGGPGYAIQRAYMRKQYHNAETASTQLWTAEECKTSSYAIGTQITDHFEVVEHTPASIVVRCGGCPRIKEVRPGEGVFEMAVDVKKEEGVAEFHLRSVFWQGLGKAEGKPFSEWYMDWLHKQYDKVWMESAVRNVTK
ncbi:hypothetical protein CYLTODRAFT_420336 [Cylindrobasidium torrendii FP15055 ss-10]|uniref:Uncharacterized protein n=1 Tax=Cylindrobasidium torrendii FP15055 ss-10 TaxID=1314674 RepID=A0A0D7BI74_9AGAR|nr:hypothetical protein CYLTODRAFT_420336 [Cylindrobasidium torrendii FP15055 ss-10]